MKKIEYIIEYLSEGINTVIAESGGKQLPLHSRRSPMREAGSLNVILDPERYDLLIVLGCGLGYQYADSTGVMNKYRSVIVIDILEDIDREISKNAATSVIAGLENIVFITGKPPEEIRELLKERIDFGKIRGVQVSDHLSSLRIFPEYYTAVRRVITTLIDEAGRNRATAMKFGKLFFRNALNNILGANPIRPVSVFREKFRGRAAVIVSSAPSVELFMERIAELAGYAYIIAVDSAVPLLHEHGVKPDFTVSIDPQGIIGEHLNGHENYGGVFIHSVVSPPWLIRRTGGFLSMNSHPLAQLFDEVTGESIGSVDSSTGSVAGDALDFAITAGFEYIAMTGFDFSFSKNLIYARGTAYQNRYCSIFNNRLRTAETFNSDYIFRSSRSLKYSGRYTRRAFLDYRASLAKVTCRHRKLYFINNIDPAYVPENMTIIDPDSFGKLAAEKVSGKKPVPEIIKNEKFSDYLIEKKQYRELLDNKDILGRIAEASLGGGTECTTADYAAGLLKSMDNLRSIK